MMIYYETESGKDVGHVVVPYDYEETSNGYKLCVYDPNSLRESYLIINNVNENGTDTAELKYGNYTIESLAYYESMSSQSNVFNKYDIDSPYNDFGAGTSAVNDGSDAEYDVITPDQDNFARRYLVLRLDGNFKITNAEGESLYYINGELSGDMKVYHSDYVFGKDEWVFEVNDSTNFTYTKID